MGDCAGGQVVGLQKIERRQASVVQAATGVVKHTEQGARCQCVPGGTDAPVRAADGDAAFVVGPKLRDGVNQLELGHGGFTLICVNPSRLDDGAPLGDLGGYKLLVLGGLNAFVRYHHSAQALLLFDEVRVF